VVIVKQLAITLVFAGKLTKGNGTKGA